MAYISIGLYSFLNRVSMRIEGRTTQGEGREKRMGRDWLRRGEESRRVQGEMTFDFFPCLSWSFHILDTSEWDAFLSLRRRGLLAEHIV
jgi:hypothetical protein